jgi:hypothetical protein
MAVDFDGTNDRIDYANVADLSGAAFSASLWSTLDVTGTGLWYFINFQNPAGTPITNLFNNGGGGAGALQLSRTGATTKFRTSTSGAITTGTLYNIVATDTGSNTGTDIHIYVNGTEVSYASAGDGATPLAADGAWVLGGRTGDNLRNINGRLSDVAVWNRVLSANEIAMLANAYSPHFIRRGLLFAPKLLTVTADGIVDPISGKTATAQNGPVSFAHPRIIYPAPRTTRRFTTAVAGGGIPTLVGPRFALAGRRGLAA